MIQLKYRGGMGNRFFVYCLGRILSERFGYALRCKKIEGFSNTIPIVGEEHKENQIRIDLHNVDETIKDIENNKHHQLVMPYSLQQYRFYKNHKEKIKQWLKPDLKINNISDLDFRIRKNNSFEKINVDKINIDDIIIVQRLGDFIDLRLDLKFNYFDKILKNIKFNRIFIISDEIESETFNKFNDYNPIFLFGNAFVHYSFASFFNRMIISQSTYSWWIAWLSNAKEIYLPFSSGGNWSERWIKRGKVNLIVDDENRYNYVREIPKESDYFFEKRETIFKIAKGEIN
jgi:hypothetical protein